MVVRRVTVPIAVVGLVLTLSACSPLSIFSNWGGSPTPGGRTTTTPEALPTPSGSSPASTPTASPTPGCIDRVISAAGTYRLGDCENLTVAGSGITVTAGHLGTLTVMGNSLQVYAAAIGELDVQGDTNTLQTSDDIGTLKLMGNSNMIACHGGMNTASVNGDDNTVRVDAGVSGDVQNTGQRNTIGAQP
ncbi:MAG: hypothetical protein ABUT11_00690 [Leifsonia sp.]